MSDPHGTLDAAVMYLLHACVATSAGAMALAWEETAVTALIRAYRPNGIVSVNCCGVSVQT